MGGDIHGISSWFMAFCRRGTSSSFVSFRLLCAVDRDITRVAGAGVPVTTTDP